VTLMAKDRAVDFAPDNLDITINPASVAGLPLYVGQKADEGHMKPASKVPLLAKAIPTPSRWPLTTSKPRSARS